MGRWGLAVVVACAGAAFAQSQIQLTKVAGGLEGPTHVTGAGDGGGRLFVVEQAGRIRIVKNGATVAPAFLDIRDRVGCCGERGLLSVAFPPGFPTPGHFYVYYTDTAGDVTISRFSLGAGADTANPASETVILRISHRQYANHNGGQLAFGPDGYLYIGTGDGGGAGDPLGSGQNTNTLLGKILRIDVESGGEPYTIPPSNPFANQSGHRGEVWAYGLRNPWRFSFDRATDSLYIGDVGQGTYEEIDYQLAASAGGENYGWNRTEGMHCYQAGCNMNGITHPVAEYSHGAGDCSVTGGFVYRGARYPALTGTYFYGDYCTGRVWTLKQAGTAWQNALAMETGFNISSFGEDDDGELYLVEQSAGDMYRITGPAPAIGIAAVVNAASFEPGLAPGSLATIFGTGITNAAGIVSAPGVPLPTELDGISVLVDGVPAPLVAVARVNGLEQINFQVPFEAASRAGVPLVVKNGTQESAAFAAAVTSAAAALFTTDGTHAAAQHADYRPIVASDAASDGEVVLVYGTGLGPVSGAPPTGVASPLNPLAHTVTPAVTIGGRPATVEFSGLTPFLVGVYQVNARVPAGLTAGEHDIVVTVAGGVESKPVKLFVR